MSVAFSRRRSPIVESADRVFLAQLPWATERHCANHLGSLPPEQREDHQRDLVHFRDNLNAKRKYLVLFRACPAVHAPGAFRGSQTLKAAIKSVREARSPASCSQ